MAIVVAEFFQIIGVEATAPTTIAELIPYLLTVFVGVVLVLGVFGVIKEIAISVMDWRRFR